MLSWCSDSGFGLGFDFVQIVKNKLTKKPICYLDFLHSGIILIDLCVVIIISFLGITVFIWITITSTP